MIVTDDRVARYVGSRVNATINPPFTAIGIERDGEIVAGCIFNNFTGCDVDVTVAGKRGSFTPRFVKAVGQYVFNALDCRRMSITTEQPLVIRIATRLGAQNEGRKRNHFGKGRDGIMLGILREDWKYR